MGCVVWPEEDLDHMRTRTRLVWGLLGALAVMALLAPVAVAHDPDDDVADGGSDHLHPAGDLSAALSEHDAATAGVVSSVRVPRTRRSRSEGTWPVL